MASTVVDSARRFPVTAQRPMKVVTLGPFDGDEWMADRVADALGDVEGYTVVMDGRRLIQGWEPYAQRFVERVMVEGKAHDIAIVWPQAEFVGFLEKALAKHGLHGRIWFAPIMILRSEGLEGVA